jgi:hypothetical protein
MIVKELISESHLIHLIWADKDGFAVLGNFHNNKGTFCLHSKRGMIARNSAKSENYFHALKHEDRIECLSTGSVTCNVKENFLFHSRIDRKLFWQLKEKFGTIEWQEEPV